MSFEQREYERRHMSPMYWDRRKEERRKLWVRGSKPKMLKRGIFFALMLIGVFVLVAALR